MTPITRTDQSELIYLFEWTKIDLRPALQVDVVFRGEASGESLIVLPDAAVNGGHLDRGFKNLEALTPDVRLFSVSDPTRRKAVHAPGEIIHLRFNWVPTDSSTRERFDLHPVIEEAYCAFLAQSALIRPDWPEKREISFSVRWLKPPSDWIVFDSQKLNQTTQSYSATFSKFGKIAFFGGDFRLDQNGSDSRLQIGIRGQWPFPDEMAFASVREQWKKMQTFWGPDRPLPGLLVFLKSSQDCCHFQGTAALDSYIVTASAEEGWGPSIRELLSDELFFYPIRKRSAAFSSWSLGLIRFFSRSLDLTSGTLSLETWISDLNHMLAEQSLSPARLWPEAQLRTRSNEPWVRRQYYLRPDYFMQKILFDWLKSGHTIASLFDRLKQAAEVAGTEPFDQVLLKLIESDLKQPLLAEWKKHVIQGEPWTQDARLAGGCLDVMTRAQAPFDLGFDWERSKVERRIRGLNSRTAAAQAGLRNGQSLLRWKILFGDAESPVELWVRSGHEEKYFRYHPRAQKTVKVPYFSAEGTAQARSLQCLSRAGIQFLSVAAK